MSPAEVLERLSAVARRRAWALRVATMTGPIAPVMELVRDPSDDAVESVLRHLEHAWGYAEAVGAPSPCSYLVPAGWALLGRVRARDEVAA